MACPLSLLRLYNVNRTPIVETDDQVVFGDASWPKNARTSYLMYKSDKENTPNTYYTLGCLLYLLQNERLPHGTYIKKATSNGIPIVCRPDRRELLAYLNGERATSSSIDRFAPLEPPIKRRAAEDLSSDIPASKKPRLAEQPYLAAKLDAPREVTVLTDNIKSLSEAMSVERIAAIKAKRIAKKRSTIKDCNDDIDQNSNVDDNAKEVIARERLFRTRSSILQSSNKEFVTQVMHILKSIAARDKAAEMGKMVPTPRPTASPPRRQVATEGYNRYDQQRFVPQKEATQGFVIDTMGSYHGWSLKSVTEGNVSLTKPTVAPTIPSVVSRRSNSRTPIIVIPSSESSLVTTYNAVDVLQDLTFRTTAEKKARGAKRENEILLQRRKRGDLTVPYLVVDNPTKLKKDDWDRVVAVLVMGPQWQFKGWPYEGNPVEIFARIPAFHFKYDEVPIDNNVAKWAVKVIEVSKTRRHLDRAAISEFWEVLDRHLAKNKQYLRF